MRKVKNNKNMMGLRANIKVKCMYSEFGCNAILDFDNQEEHYKTCGICGLCG